MRTAQTQIQFVPPMADAFYFKINGETVSPDTVDLLELSRLLTTFYRAVKATCGKESDCFLALTGVEHACNKLTLRGTETTIAGTRLINRAISDNQPDLLPETARGHLHSLWQQLLEQDHWQSLEILGNGSEVGNFILTKEREPFPERQTYTGRTVFYGRCTRAGGSRKATAEVELSGHSGRAFRVSLASTTLAQDLGKRLYQTIGLEGTAEWDTRTDELVSFRAERLTEYQGLNEDGTPRTAYQAFASLADAAEERWKDVDPERYVDDLRNDEA